LTIEEEGVDVPKRRMRGGLMDDGEERLEMRMGMDTWRGWR
jgi:hypothetical protein